MHESFYIQLFFSVDCGPPPKIANGTANVISTSDSVSGSRIIAAYYLCNGGATLVGNRTIDCRDDGTWEDPPMCVPVGEYMN